MFFIELMSEELEPPPPGRVIQPVRPTAASSRDEAAASGRRDARGDMVFLLLSDWSIISEVRASVSTIDHTWKTGGGVTGAHRGFITHS